ncbi:MAG: Holliday junction branch migration protein RuvA [Candidatus Peribacteraceae bacterium]
MLHAVFGMIEKLQPPHVSVETSGGVSYLVSVPLHVYEELEQGKEAKLLLASHIREDRFDLFGFLTRQDRTLYQALVNLDGIGPKTALEICSLPRALFFTAIVSDDVKMLTSVKGIGKKTAEKLLVDLKQLLEKHPEWSSEAHLPSADGTRSASMDSDAVAALVSLGYDEQSAMRILRSVPSTVTRTEDRVAAALRAL